MSLSGRCIWCGCSLDTTNATCPDCASQMVFISPSWVYDKDGNVKEDPGWHGPAKFLPARYRTKEKLCLV